MKVCCNVTPCCWVSGSSSFNGPHSIHLQGQAVQVESPCTMTQGHIQGDWNFQLLNFQACASAFRSKQFRKKFFLDSLTLAAEDTTVLQNVGNHAQNNILSLSIRPEFSSFKFMWLYCLVSHVSKSCYTHDNLPHQCWEDHTLHLPKYKMAPPIK
jgi:hypothetical protein